MIVSRKVMIESLARNNDEVLCKALDRLAPKRTRTIVIRPNAPWYNEEHMLAYLMNQQNKKSLESIT